MVRRNDIAAEERKNQRHPERRSTGESLNEVKHVHCYMVSWRTIEGGQTEFSVGTVQELLDVYVVHVLEYAEVDHQCAIVKAQEVTGCDAIHPVIRRV